MSALRPTLEGVNVNVDRDFIISIWRLKWSNGHLYWREEGQDGSIEWFRWRHIW